MRKFTTKHKCDLEFSEVPDRLMQATNTVRNMPWPTAAWEMRRRSIAGFDSLIG
jgi:hypothetical protein